ncbi:hypothetical protein U9M48_035309 [Paspalum notatum var. saurae]|uniref:Uncharacterized protein n=1 Tax=Paspalum notatum var. saurae TaxID=547442 RepID=A0AAQ3X8W2_PASNO
MNSSCSRGEHDGAKARWRDGGAGQGSAEPPAVPRGRVDLIQDSPWDTTPGMAMATTGGVTNRQEIGPAGKVVAGGTPAADEGRATPRPWHRWERAHLPQQQS